jgi:hypothetical protein
MTRGVAIGAATQCDKIFSAGELSVFGPSDIDNKAPDRQGTDDEKTDIPRSVAFSSVTRHVLPSIVSSFLIEFHATVWSFHLAGDADNESALSGHAYGSFIALIFNCFSFFFTARSYQRVEKIQSALLQIGSAFSQNAAC